MANEYDKDNFTLILYEKVGNLEPIFKGFKVIDKKLYDSLTKDYQMRIEVGSVTWGIRERVCFKEPIVDTMYYRVILFAEKM